MHLRDFTPDDYQALTDIRNAIYPDMPIAVEDFRHADSQRDAKCLHRRWMAIHDDQVVGVGQYDQSLWAYHPQHFYVQVRILPEFQGRGFGSTLYDTVLEALAQFDPIRLEGSTRDDKPRAMRWLEKRGFTLHIREQRSALDLDDFDPAPWAGLEDKLNAEGIVLKAVSELTTDADWERKLYDLDMIVTVDVPGFDDFTPPTFERWKLDITEHPLFSPDTFLVAVQNGQYVGSTGLWADRTTDILHTGLTAVRREYRRKGIATALKVNALTRAKALGCPRINTDNEENNPMLQINYDLGFKDTPAWMIYRKAFGGGEN